jgi:protein gp37
LPNTKIEWAEKTWSPVLGCSKVSAGCQHCYAIQNVWRLGHNPNPKVSQPHVGLVVEQPIYFTGDPAPLGRQDEMRLRWTGEARCLAERLDQPEFWKKPSRIFVCPMADLFHEKVPDEFIGLVFGRMAMSNHHRYLLLTKRPERMAELMGQLDRYFRGVALDHIWFGVSVENQEQANKRIPILMSLPMATHRWVSAEPLLGPLNLWEWLYPGGIEWVVAGCESGKGARPDDLDWYESLILQCRPVITMMRSFDIPIFIKQARYFCGSREQWGALVPGIVKMPRIMERQWAIYPPELVTK